MPDDYKVDKAFLKKLSEIRKSKKNNSTNLLRWVQEKALKLPSKGIVSSFLHKCYGKSVGYDKCFESKEQTYLVQNLSQKKELIYSFWKEHKNDKSDAERKTKETGKQHPKNLEVAKQWQKNIECRLKQNDLKSKRQKVEPISVEDTSRKLHYAKPVQKEEEHFQVVIIGKERDLDFVNVEDRSRKPYDIKPAQKEEKIKKGQEDRIKKERYYDNVILTEKSRKWSHSKSAEKGKISKKKKMKKDDLQSLWSEGYRMYQHIEKQGRDYLREARTSDSKYRRFLRQNMEMMLKEYAAITIQNWWKKAKKSDDPRNENFIFGEMIGLKLTMLFNKLLRELAVIVIQKWWRKILTVRIPIASEQGKIFGKCVSGLTMAMDALKCDLQLANELWNAAYQKTKTIEIALHKLKDSDMDERLKLFKFLPIIKQDFYALIIQTWWRIHMQNQIGYVPFKRTFASIIFLRLKVKHLFEELEQSFAATILQQWSQDISLQMSEQSQRRPVTLEELVQLQIVRQKIYSSIYAVKQDIASTIIQSRWRIFDQRRRYIRDLALISQLQAIVKMQLAKTEAKKFKAEITDKKIPMSVVSEKEFPIAKKGEVAELMSDSRVMKSFEQVSSSETELFVKTKDKKPLISEVTSESEVKHVSGPYKTESSSQIESVTEKEHEELYVEEEVFSEIETFTDSALPYKETSISVDSTDIEASVESWLYNDVGYKKPSIDGIVSSDSETESYSEMETTTDGTIDESVTESKDVGESLLGDDVKTGISSQDICEGDSRTASVSTDMLPSEEKFYSETEVTVGKPDTEELTSMEAETTTEMTIDKTFTVELTSEEKYTFESKSMVGSLVGSETTAEISSADISKDDLKDRTLHEHKEDILSSEGRFYSDADMTETTIEKSYTEELISAKTGTTDGTVDESVIEEVSIETYNFESTDSAESIVGGEVNSEISSADICESDSKVTSVSTDIHECKEDVLSSEEQFFSKPHTEELASTKTYSGTETTTEMTTDKSFTEELSLEEKYAFESKDAVECLVSKFEAEISSTDICEGDLKARSVSTDTVFKCKEDTLSSEDQFFSVTENVEVAVENLHTKELASTETSIEIVGKQHTEELTSTETETFSGIVTTTEIMTDKTFTEDISSEERCISESKEAAESLVSDVAAEVLSAGICEFKSDSKATSFSTETALGNEEVVLSSKEESCSGSETTGKSHTEELTSAEIGTNSEAETTDKTSTELSDEKRVSESKDEFESLTSGDTKAEISPTDIHEGEDDLKAISSISTDIVYVRREVTLSSEKLFYSEIDTTALTVEKLYREELTSTETGTSSSKEATAEETIDKSLTEETSTETQSKDASAEISSPDICKDDSKVIFPVSLDEVGEYKEGTLSTEEQLDSGTEIAETERTVEKVDTEELTSSETDIISQDVIKLEGADVTLSETKTHSVIETATETTVVKSFTEETFTETEPTFKSKEAMESIVSKEVIAEISSSDICEGDSKANLSELKDVLSSEVQLCSGTELTETTVDELHTEELTSSETDVVIEVLIKLEDTADGVTSSETKTYSGTEITEAETLTTEEFPSSETDILEDLIKLEVITDGVMSLKSYSGTESTTTETQLISEEATEIKDESTVEFLSDDIGREDLKITLPVSTDVDFPHDQDLSDEFLGQLWRSAFYMSEQLDEKFDTIEENIRENRKGMKKFITSKKREISAATIQAWWKSLWKRKHLSSTCKYEIEEKPCYIYGYFIRKKLNALLRKIDKEIAIVTVQNVIRQFLKKLQQRKENEKELTIDEGEIKFLSPMESVEEMKGKVPLVEERQKGTNFIIKVQEMQETEKAAVIEFTERDVDGFSEAEQSIKSLPIISVIDTDKLHEIPAMPSAPRLSIFVEKSASSLRKLSIQDSRYLLLLEKLIKDLRMEFSALTLQTLWSMIAVQKPKDENQKKIASVKVFFYGYLMQQKMRNLLENLDRDIAAATIQTWFRRVKKNYLGKRPKDLMIRQIIEGNKAWRQISTLLTVHTEKVSAVAINSWWKYCNNLPQNEMDS